MKKIIILITILCGMGFCKTKIDYNKALEKIGGNCKLESSISKSQKKVFICDSGYISFDFDEYEILLSYHHISENGHKRKIILSFNRGFNKHGKQIHKDKSVIFWVFDEFDVHIDDSECQWSDEGGKFYEKFKEDIYYGKRDSNVNYNKEWNNEDSVYSTENEVKDTEPKDQYTEYRIAQIMEKYK